MRFGILGGSFNPPHLGHLALAATVLDLGLVDRVCFIPAASPPHKRAPAQADPRTRLAMTRLLAGSDPRFLVDGLELERNGPSYTIDTIHELMARHPGDRYRLIIGSDLAKTFATWRMHEEILRLAPPLVAERPDSPFTGGDEYPGLSPEEAAVMRRGRFSMPPMDVSSTKIRRLFQEGATDGELLQYLSSPVLRYIRENNLYASGPSS